MRTRLHRFLVATLLVALASGPLLAEEAPDVVRALDTDDAAARATAVEALSTHPERDRLVAEALRDAEQSGSLGEPALLALIAMADAEDVPFSNAGLRDLVRNADAPSAVRAAAATALGNRGTVADVSALGDAIGDLPREASMALVAIGGRAAQNALRRGGGDDPPLAVRAALAQMGDEEQYAMLVAALRSDDAARREDAGELLRWATGRDLSSDADTWETYLRQRSLARQLGQEDLKTAQTAVQELSAVLASRTSGSLEGDLAAILVEPSWSEGARGRAALVLGLGDAQNSQDALLEACANLQPGMVRLYAAEALARVGDLSLAVPFARLLVHDEDRDRIKAQRGSQGEYFPVDPALARTLFRKGVPGAVVPLLKVMNGEFRTRMHRDVLRAMVEASGGDDFGFEADSARADRDAAMVLARAWWDEGRETMGLTPDPNDPGWPAFRAHVDEEIEKLGAFKFLHQWRARMALEIVTEPALPQILAALDHESLHVRMGIAQVLHVARLRASASALAARLAKEDNPAVRSRLAWALEVCARRSPDGTPADEAVREALRNAVGDSSLDVRIAAARALGTAGADGRDIDALIAARARAGNESPAFRAASAGALLQLVHHVTLPDLFDELACNDVARRAAAASLLQSEGIDLLGYDPDASDDERADVVNRLRARHGVSPGGHE